MDYMWQHYCKVERSLMGVENGKPCNWCGEEEKKSNIYKAKFWMYPARSLVHGRNHKNITDS